MDLSENYQLSFLVSKYKENGKWILYNWRNTKNITIDDNTHPLYIILDNINKSLEFKPFHISGSYDDFNYLYENNFIVSNQDETVSFVEEEYKKTNRHTKLELVLMPVNQACNFNCIYCYEDHSQKNRMGTYEQNVIKKFIEKHNLDELSVDYFGGEPLLNSKFIIEFNTLIIKYATLNSIKFTSSMTTNGYLLTKDLLINLLEAKINNYQISLDGSEEDHNRLRPLANGNETYNKIYNNLIEISNLPEKYSFMIIIRINFNESNSQQNKQELLLSKLKSGLNNDKRFVINPHTIVNWKQEKDSELYISKNKGNEIEIDYKDNIKRFKLNPFNMVNFSGIESNSCYADKKNTYVIFPSDNSKNTKNLPVQKCTIGIFDEFNNIGFISEKGDFFENENINKWITGSPFKKEGCQECFFVLNCYGSACPLNSIRTGLVKCPNEKYKEVETVKEIMSFISEN